MSIVMGTRLVEQRPTFRPKSGVKKKEQETMNLNCVTAWSKFRDTRRDRWINRQTDCLKSDILHLLVSKNTFIDLGSLIRYKILPWLNTAEK